MWGTILLVITLVAVVLAIVWLFRSVATMRRAGYSILTKRVPLAGLPAKTRQQVLRAVRRGEPVAPEHEAEVRRWADFQTKLGGFGWMYFWLAVALISFVLDRGWGPEHVVEAVSSTLLAMLLLVLVGAVLLSRDRAAAKRLLRDTPPPA